ncbi:5-methylcytosine-specific restriction endonuclease McrA [Neomicrococcus aestuarii]|uniref:5-methylcytosine-specific restriction endonuclease McrA n=1 Tax=Neomicrococcus aestuarii TaxID=556325 RepID=A0A7W8X121_9MICC|nr:HNH endonuclease [Neomicrococcus aestuarii]MBB5513468.1 5-methylcytosine-specific restriction endonuclease McrA [Neomicrococcus aestuarii]
MPILACSVEDVSHTPGKLTRGMCPKHYQRFRKYGDATKVHSAPRNSVPAEDALRLASNGGRSISSAQDAKKLSRSSLTCCECGKKMWEHKTSAPQGIAKCLDCRIGDGHNLTGYKHGCRCDACKASKAEKNRKYKEEFRAIHGIGPSSKWKRDNGGMPPRVEWIDRKVRRTIYERDNWICWLCNEAVDDTALPRSNYYPSLDHIIPRSKGGDHNPENLRTAHMYCNAKRRDLDASKVGDLFGWKKAAPICSPV